MAEGRQRPVGLLSLGPMMPLSAAGHTNAQHLEEAGREMRSQTEPGGAKTTKVTVMIYQGKQREENLKFLLNQKFRILEGSFF